MVAQEEPALAPLPTSNRAVYLCIAWLVVLAAGAWTGRRLQKGGGRSGVLYGVLFAVLSGFVALLCLGVLPDTDWWLVSVFLTLVLGKLML